MESGNENFNISIKESLLVDHDQQPTISKHTRFYKNRKLIYSFFLILATLIAGSIILSCVSKKKQSQPLHRYLSSWDQDFCYSRTYPNTCYDSVSSILNSTESLKTNPGPIFSSSVKLSINQLKSLSAPGLSKCGALIQDSLSRLNESLYALDVDLDVDTLTYEEVDNIKAWISDAVNNTLRCVQILEENGGDKGVMEVIVVLKIAREYMVNSIELLDMRESILFDFYNPSLMETEFQYYDYFYYNFDYRSYVVLYSIMYLLIALLTSCSGGASDAVIPCNCKNMYSDKCFLILVVESCTPSCRLF